MSNLQPGAVIAHANATDLVEYCENCDAPCIRGPYCSKQCADNDRERDGMHASEVAYGNGDR